MKLSAISLLLLVVACGTNPPSDPGATGDVGSGGSNSSTGGGGSGSGAINVPTGGSSSGAPGSAGTSSAGTSALGGTASGGSTPGGSAGTSSAGAGGTSSGGAGGTSSGGAGDTSSGGGGGSMLQTDITARFATGDTNTDTPIPAIQGQLSVVNADGGSAHLDLLKVRYYFTNEAPALAFQRNFGYVSSPGNQVDVPFTGTVVAMADPKPTADSYLEFDFQSTAIVDAGKTLVLNFRLYNSPSQQPILIQSNDYSFNLTPMVDTDKIVLLYRDVVIWGVEP
jgi:hypothetical protein